MRMYSDRVGSCSVALRHTGFSPAAARKFKVREDIRFVDTLLREASGKIFKRKLRDHF
jgi:acyl-coenzyme A synthetase/AMP-(fatty) acid ligase